MTVPTRPAFSCHEPLALRDGDRSAPTRWTPGALPSLAGAATTATTATTTAAPVVTHHPWILTRENQVDLQIPSTDLSLATRATAAARELEARSDAILAVLIARGSNEYPPEVFKPARKMARTLRRLSSARAQPDTAQRVEDFLDEARPIPELAGTVDAWADALGASHAAMAALEAHLDEQLAAERVHVSQALSHPALRMAAPLSSTTLATSAARYAAEISSSGALSSHSRKSEPRLVRLVQRALHRVSPFSHYTAVGLAWDGTDPAAPDLPLVARQDDAPISSLQADIASLSRMVRAHLDVLGDRTPLVAAEYRQAGPETLSVSIAVDDPSGRSRVFDGTVRTATMRRTPSVEAILNAASDGPVTVEQLAARFGSDEKTSAGVLRLCHQLRAIGALQVWNPVSPGDADVVAGAAERGARLAEAWGSDAHGSLLEHLERIGQAQRRVALSGPQDRGETLEALKEAWTGTGSASSRPVYEDVTHRTVVSVPAETFSLLRDDLSVLAGATDVFDNTHLGHGLLHLGLLERTHDRREMSFAEFADLVPQILAESNTDRESMMARLSAHDPSVDGLLAARAQAAAQLVEAAARGDQEVVWSKDQVRQWQGATHPALRRGRMSVAWFLQATRVGSGRVEQAVINAVHDGDAQMFSRFLSAWDPAFTEQVRSRLGADLAEDHVELAPVHGFNANVHPWLLPRAFRSDGVDGSRWPEILDPSSLRVRIGEHTIHALDSRGRTVHPHYFGFLVPFLLPPTAAALYMLGRGPLIRMDLGTDVEREAGDQDVVVHPRVRHGSIVVTRRAVSLPATAFPLQEPGETMGSYLLRMNSFRARYDLPIHVFLRAEPRADAIWQQFVAMRTKPLPVDLSSPLHLRLLPQWLADAHRVRVTEALPDTHERPTMPWGSRSCSEFVLETVTRYPQLAH